MSYLFIFMSIFLFVSGETLRHASIVFVNQIANQHRSEIMNKIVQTVIIVAVRSDASRSEWSA